MKFLPFLILLPLHHVFSTDNGCPLVENNIPQEIVLQFFSPDQTRLNKIVTEQQTINNSALLAEASKSEPQKHQFVNINDIRNAIIPCYNLLLTCKHFHHNESLRNAIAHHTMPLLEIIVPSYIVCSFMPVPLFYPVFARVNEADLTEKLLSMEHISQEIIICLMQKENIPEEKLFTTNKMIDKIIATDFWINTNTICYQIGHVRIYGFSFVERFLDAISLSMSNNFKVKERRVISTQSFDVIYGHWFMALNNFLKKTNVDLTLPLMKYPGRVKDLLSHRLKILEKFNPNVEQDYFDEATLEKIACLKPVANDSQSSPFIKYLVKMLLFPQAHLSIIFDDIKDHIEIYKTELIRRQQILHCLLESERKNFTGEKYNLEQKIYEISLNKFLRDLEGITRRIALLEFDDRTITTIYKTSTNKNIE